MCEQHAEILEALEKFGERLIALENKVEHINECSDRLDLLVMGNEGLGVPPMRETLGELALAYDRAKWGAGVLGITNIGAFIALVVALSKIL